VVLHASERTGKAPGMVQRSCLLAVCGLFGVRRIWCDTVAQFDLAVCYRNGFGVDKDPKEAFSWFLRAAQGVSLGLNTTSGYFTVMALVLTKMLQKL